MGVTINTLGVVGAGQMGSGIAQVGAQAGLDVKLVDPSTEQLKKAQTGIRTSLEKLHSKGRLEKAPEAIMERIRLFEQIDPLSECDYVVEAVTEREEIKFDIFRRLDSVCRPETLLATNTSSIPITNIAGQTNRPTQVIGMHFMNPVPLMPLIEIIPGLQTAHETVDAATQLASFLGKEIVVSRDRAGFIVNRVLLPMINGAIQAVYDGTAEAADIDRAMKIGTNQPMGPLALADMIGLDTCLEIMDVLHDSFGDRYKPSPLLRQYVAAGWLGRKTGRGFYEYSKKNTTP